MDNKVGENLPTSARTQAWTTQLKDLRAEMGKYTIKLSSDERKHLAQFRPGGESIVALVGDLAVKYGIHLPDMPINGMRDDLTLVQRLAPLYSELSLLLSQVDDTIAQARSEAWQAATGNYSVLSRVAAANPSLAKELEPAKEFFARRRRATGAPAVSGNPESAPANGPPPAGVP
jgi:hypothetical protein